MNIGLSLSIWGTCARTSSASRNVARIAMTIVRMVLSIASTLLRRQIPEHTFHLTGGRIIGVLEPVIRRQQPPIRKLGRERVTDCVPVIAAGEPMHAAVPREHDAILGVPVSVAITHDRLHAQRIM